LNEGQAKGGDEMDGGSQAEVSNRGSQAINQSMMDSD
jgi:hypothetical protein